MFDLEQLRDAVVNAERAKIGVLTPLVCEMGSLLKYSPEHLIQRWM